MRMKWAGVILAVCGMGCAGCGTTTVRLPADHGLTVESSVKILDRWAKANTHPDYQDAAGATVQGWVIYGQHTGKPEGGWNPRGLYWVKVWRTEYAHAFRDIDHVEIETSPLRGVMGSVMTLLMINPAAFACHGRIVMKDGGWRRLALLDMELAEERRASYKTCFPFYLFFPTRPVDHMKKLARHFEFMREQQEQVAPRTAPPKP